jgi:hypothetical protein
MQFMPRYSIYVDSESTGKFVVNAGISKYHGKPITPSVPGEPIDVTIKLASTGDVLAQNTMQVDSMGNLLRFDLTGLKA